DGSVRRSRGNDGADPPAAVADGECGARATERDARRPAQVLAANRDQRANSSARWREACDRRQKAADDRIAFSGDCCAVGRGDGNRSGGRADGDDGTDLSVRVHGEGRRVDAVEHDGGGTRKRATGDRDRGSGGPTGWREARNRRFEANEFKSPDVT